MKIFKVLAVLAVAGGGLWIYNGYLQGETDRASKAAVAQNDIGAYVRAINEGAKNISVEQKAPGDVVITWRFENALSADSFKSRANLETAKTVPAVFGAFPSVNKITLVRFGPFADIRGNQTVQRAMEAQFSRRTSAAINWKNILWDNVPKLADSYWTHPGL